MRRIFGIAALAAALVAVSAQVQAQAETIGNAEVIQLAGVGLGDEAVIAKIKASETTFDITTKALIELKKKGVSSPVIAAMIAASSAGRIPGGEASSFVSNAGVPSQAGVYLLEEWHSPARMTAIDPTTSGQTRTGNIIGYVLTGGIARMSYKAVIPRTEARAKAPLARPVFYFNFGQPEAGSSSAFSTVGTIATPKEFSLVQFKVGKDGREAKVGSFNLGGTKSGVAEKDQIPFEASQVSPGIYRVQPDTDLENGEYGFVYVTPSNGGPGAARGSMQSARIFDFSIDDGSS